MRATWIDPHTGRQDEASIKGHRIEGAWIVLDCMGDAGTMGREHPATMYVPATTIVRIERG